MTKNPVKSALARRLFAVCAAGPMLASAAAEEPVHIGARRELFVDRFLIESLDGARLRLHEPIPAETVLRGGPEHPWEGAGSTAVAVWKDGDRFRMHYRCIATKDFQAGKFQPEWAIAESRDGIHWTRPLRDARALAFGRLSNLVADDQGRPLPSMTSIALNARPGAPADQRYIGLNILRPRGDMAYSTATLYTSPDGFRWTRFREEPVYETDLYNAFDSQPMIFWSEAEGQYVMLHRYLIQGEQAGADSLPGMRSVARTTSPDLMTWSEPVKMSYDELGRLDPYVNFYTNGTQPCPGAPHLYVALYARLMPGRKVITESQALGLDLPTWNQFRYDVECSDSALMTARVEEPTLYRQTFKETFIRPGFGPQHWTSRSNFALAGVLETGPAEWSVYVNRGYLQTDWRVQRLTIRRDGFASVRAPWAGGEMITRPLVFEGSFLTVNHANGAPGEIRVELQDEDGAPIPGFELNACDPIYGDNVERGVTWRGGDGDVGGLAGRPVRVRFALRDADLYAMQFRDEPPEPVAFVLEPPARIPDAPALDAPGGAMTVEAYLNVDAPDGAPSAARVMSKYNHLAGDEGRGWEIQLLPDGRAVFRTNQVSEDGEGVDRQVESETPLPLNEWVHLAAVFDRPERRIRLYVDGRQAGEREIPDLPLRRTADRDLMIGRYGDPRSIVMDFRGRIDELRIVDRALTFHGPPDRPYTGREPGAVALYHFDERGADGTASNAIPGSPVGAVRGVTERGERRLVESLPGFGRALGMKLSE
jgi:hypothetical protein